MLAVRNPRACRQRVLLPVNRDFHECCRSGILERKNLVMAGIENLEEILYPVKPSSRCRTDWRQDSSQKKHRANVKSGKLKIVYLADAVFENCLASVNGGLVPNGH